MTVQPLFTVFTATYNRRLTLPRVYASLCAQTCQDFEWVIVDDGSTDGTSDLVSEWQTEARFPIRYFYQENRGKHVAFNSGVAEARGRLFLTFDSDDECFSNALEQFTRLWETIPASEQIRFANVTVLCVDHSGRVVGRPFPRPIVDAYTVQQQIEMRCFGEKWGINRTDVLRQFPFPVIQGEKWVPEGLVWNRISKRYAARFANEKLRIYRRTGDALSTGAQVPIRARNPFGSRLYYVECMELEMPLAWRCRQAVNYCRFSFHASIGIARMIKDARPRWLAWAALPFGYVAYLSDCYQLGSRGTRVM